MKNAKEEAQRLVDKFRTYIRIADKYDYNLSEDEIYLAKQCTLTAVNEIIKVAFFASDEIYNHYLKVKTEIENYE